MAVYTKVTERELGDFIALYNIGMLQGFDGIIEGVSNTNYHVFTDKGRYVLTLFEPHRVQPPDIPFFTAYADHLAAAGLPAASLVKDRNGQGIKELAGRAAILSVFLTGADIAVADVTATHCHAAGLLLAHMHQVAELFPLRKKNDYGVARWDDWLQNLALEEIAAGLTDKIGLVMNRIRPVWDMDLPQGAIHGDFFPDNVFFDGVPDKADTISGLIDFHFACTDFYVYDLAIAVNAWCFDGDARFIHTRYDALLRGYESVRKLIPQEAQILPLVLQAAALRFVLSRAEEALDYRNGHNMVSMVPHDPHDFIKRLEHFCHES